MLYFWFHRVLSRFKQHIKYLLDFSVKEQIAIIAIVLMMVIVLSINFFPELYTRKPQWDFSTLDSLINQYYAEINYADSVAAATKEFDFANPDESALEIKFNLFPFNPNMLPETEWKRLGMADHQIRMIKNYERSGGKFFRKEDLRKIYSITDAEYKVLEPYIVIPSVDKPIGTPSEDLAKHEELKDEKPSIPVVDINSASMDDLIQLPQVGQWYAQRIIQYRDILGGFINRKQLLEVYRMDSARLQAFQTYITIDSTLLNRIEINKEEFSELLKHPYISFELTRLIVNYRERRGMIKSWDELVSIPGADTLLHARLQPYLDFD